MIRYRVRESFGGKCVLQRLQEYPISKEESEWVDVDYNQAPRALVSEFDLSDKLNTLEIDNAELSVRIDLYEAAIKDYKRRLGEQ